MENKILALASFLELTHIETKEIENVDYDTNTFKFNEKEYLVLTDDEANDLWDEYLDNYLEDCIYPDLPEKLKHYFDSDMWKRDAKMDGRGHSLSGYDGEEHSVTISNEEFFIYRTN